MPLSSLIDLFESSTNPDEAYSEWDRAALACSLRQPPQFNPSIALASPPQALEEQSFERYLNKWWDLLVANVLVSAPTKEGEARQAIHRRMEQLLAIPLWRDSQLATALVALNALLSGTQVALCAPSVTSSGFAQDRRELIWTGGQIPTPRGQAELGLVWAILGHLTGDNEFLRQAEKIGGWLMGVLDWNFCPPASLLQSEEDYDPSGLVTSCYLFFHSLALLLHNSQFEYAAQRQLHMIQERVQERLWKVPARSVLLASWVDSFGRAPAPRRCSMERIRVDPESFLAAYRSDSLSWFGTLMGANSGLGYLRWQELEVVNYGPQLFPRSRWEDFGIVNSCQEVKKHGDVLQGDPEQEDLLMKGRARLVRHERSETGVLSQVRRAPVWMEVEQSLKRHSLHVHAHFFTLLPLDALSFCFLVRGARCHLPESNQTVEWGDSKGVRAMAETVELQGRESLLTLSPQVPDGRLEVMPLPGHHRCWGARFLIAYEFNPAKGPCSWTLRADQGR